MILPFSPPPIPSTRPLRSALLFPGVHSLLAVSGISISAWEGVATSAGQDGTLRCWGLQDGGGVKVCVYREGGGLLEGGGMVKVRRGGRRMRLYGSHASGTDHSGCT